jgi:hypothetical protein
LHAHEREPEAGLLEPGCDELGIERAVFDQEDAERAPRRRVDSARDSAWYSARRGHTLGTFTTAPGGGSLTAVQNIPSCLSTTVNSGEAHGLHDVRVGPEAVAARQIGRLSAARQHHDRDHPQRRVALDALEHLQPVQARQLQIEQHHRRVPLRTLGVGALPVEVIERLLAVPDDGHLVREVRLVEGGERERGVVLAVLHHQHALRLGHAGASAAAGPGKVK